jgi:hypothetical protein
MPIDPADLAAFEQQQPQSQGIDPRDAAAFAASRTPQPEGFLQSAAKAVQEIYPGFMAQQQAAGQRTTPVISAQAPNFLGPATEDELGNVGYKDANGQFVLTDKNKHVVLTDPADNTRKVYARTPATDEGVLSATGRMAGTMMGPGNIMVSKAAPVAIQAAERLGTEVPRAIATESPLVRFAGQAIAKVPGGGPLQEAIPQSIEQLGGKVSSAADLAGGAVDPALAGQGFVQGVEKVFKPRVAGETSQAYGAVERLLDPNRTQPLEATGAAVADIAARRAAAGLPGAGRAADLVGEAVNRPGGLTYSGIKDLRTNIGELLDTGILPEGFSEGELRRIYGTLSDDLRTSVINAGGPRAAIAFERANKMAAGIADLKEGLRKVVGPSTRSSEGVYQAIVRMAGTGSSADQAGLVAARAAVPPEVWQDVASTAIATLGRDRKGAFSPAIFLNDYARLSDTGKRVLFGSVGSGQVIQFLDDIAHVSERFVQAGKLANTSGTAGHQVFYTTIASIFGGLGAVATLGPKALIPPALAIGGMVGNNIMARILAAPSTAASLARWARVYQTVAARPTPAGLAAFQRTSGELANTINGTLGTTLTPQQIIRSTVESPSNAQADENQQQVPRPGR